MTGSDKHKVVIAGGGVAALEALLVIRELAQERVDVDLVTPNSDFVYRPMELAALFSDEHVQRFDLPRIAADQGARLIPDRLESVRGDAKLAVTSGRQKLSYDSLLVAVGARLRVGVAEAITIAAPGFRKDFERLLEDLESGLAKSVAFAAPGGNGWILPLYELALMTADRLDQRGSSGRVMIVTAEESPLEIFGETVSHEVQKLLSERRIKLLTNHWPVRLKTDGLVTTPNELVDADRVVALPAMSGPRISGLPESPGGFIPTDEHGCVVGMDSVYAAGDGTAFPIKQGGLAAQEAAAAAESIAARAGADVDPLPFRPVLRGLLLTGSEPTYLRTDLSQPGHPSETAHRPLWWPAAKIAARSLAPYLAARPGLRLRPTS